jgi:RNA polymerase sigma-70 factor (ECF subfamily)
MATTMDGKRFEEEIVAMLPHLFGSALRFCGNTNDAEDLVSETILKAWGALDTLQDAASFRGWIMRILLNNCRAQHRGRAARPEPESLPDETSEDFSLFEKLHQPFLLWWGNPERQFLDRLLRADLERALEALPEPFRRVVSLSDVDGFTYAEIAEALAVPIGTVRSRLARGRAIMQKALWEHASDAGLVPSARPHGAEHA